MSAALKARVHDYWNIHSCGERHATSLEVSLDLERQAEQRYTLEPYIHEFARYGDGAGKDVLEIGVGMGADHALWASARPRTLSGVDLTKRAVDFTRDRLLAQRLRSDLRRADAEALPFAEGSFDIVYSWGVLHHSPDTPRCVAEVARVLRPGGIARVMIYHKWALVGLMLWARYGALRGRPWRGLEDIYFDHLESPGTKAYTVAAATRMFEAAGFSRTTVRVQLSHGDLLLGDVGAQHRGPLLGIASALWPRGLLRRLAGQLGLYLLIEATK